MEERAWAVGVTVSATAICAEDRVALRLLIEGAGGTYSRALSREVRRPVLRPPRPPRASFRRPAPRRRRRRLITTSTPLSPAPR